MRRIVLLLLLLLTWSGTAWAGDQDEHLGGDPEIVDSGNVEVGVSDTVDGAIKLFDEDDPHWTAVKRAASQANDLMVYLFDHLPGAGETRFATINDSGELGFDTRDPADFVTSGGSSSFDLAGSTGTQTIAGGDTMHVAAGTGVLSTPVTATDTVTINTVLQRSGSNLSPATSNDRITNSVTSGSDPAVSGDSSAVSSAGGAFTYSGTGAGVGLTTTTLSSDNDSYALRGSHFKLDQYLDLDQGGGAWSAPSGTKTRWWAQSTGLWYRDASTGPYALMSKVRKNSTGSDFSRHRINFIEGSNVTLTVADDSTNDEVDVTIASTGGGGGLTSPLTTKGDIWTYSTTDDRQAVGSNHRLLHSDSSTATGLKWGQVDLTSEVNGVLPAANGGFDLSGLTPDDDIDPDADPIAYGDTSGADTNSLVAKDLNFTLLRRQPLIYDEYFNVPDGAAVTAFTTDAGTVQANGTSAGLIGTAGTGSTGNPGVAAVRTGTTTTGRCAILGGTSALIFGGGAWHFEEVMMQSTASDGTDRYTMRLGFGDSATADSTDGAYFRYVDNVNGGRWQAVTRSGGSETSTDTGTALSAATMVRFEIKVDAAASSVDFLINGSTVATNTTNIPTSGACGLMPAQIIKSLGTNNRQIQVDFSAYWHELATRR